MYSSPLTLALLFMALAPDPSCQDEGRDENLIYDDDHPIWCESNACDIGSCHRCFPRKGCVAHRKCQDQGESR